MNSFDALYAKAKNWIEALSASSRA